MTFLEYVATTLLGQRRGNYWTCPFCEHRTPSFQVRVPDDPLAKQRWKCHRCQKYGDDCDLLKRMTCPNPGEQFAERDRLRVEFLALPPEPAPTRRTFSSPRGSGSRERAETAAVEVAWANLSKAEQRVMAAAVSVAKTAGVDVESLAYYSWHSATWFRESDRRHLAECDDPRCDAVVCAAARREPAPIPKAKPAARKPIPKPKAKPR